MLSVRTLGASRVEIGQTAIGPDSSLLFALGLFLGVECHRAHTREELCELLWDKAGDDRVRHRLRQAIYRLRLLGAPVEDDADSIRINPRCVSYDASELNSDRARRLAMTYASNAMALVLPGYAPRISARWDQWTTDLRNTIYARLRHCLSAAIHECRTHQQWAIVEKLSCALLAIDPLSEEGTLARAEAVAYSGSKREALEILKGYVEELGDVAPILALPVETLRKRLRALPDLATASDIHPQTLIGRDPVLACLGERLSQASAGSLSVCYLSAPPGFGKTRVLEETTRTAVLMGIRVVKVECRDGDSARPLSVFQDVVPALMELPGALGISPQSMAQLRKLIHQPAPGEQSPVDLPPAAAYAMTQRALKDLFAAVLSEGALMFAVDNVHAADDQSLRLLSDLLNASAGTSMCVVLTSRSDRCPGPLSIADMRHGTLHALAPLSTLEATSLLGLLTEDLARPMPAPHTKWCVRIAEGNPYHLRELALHWRVTYKEFDVPESLRSLLRARLDNLPASAVRVLQTCAVLGKLCTLDLLNRLASRPATELLNDIEVLEHAHLLVADEAHLKVTHDLVTDALLSRATPVYLRQLHLATGRALENTVMGTRSMNVVWECMKHFELAGEPSLQIPFAVRVSRHLLAVGLPADACQVLERALQSVAHDDDKLRLLKELASALRLAGRWRDLARVAAILHEEDRAPRFGPASHSRHELVGFEAEFLDGQTDEHLLYRVTQCVRDVTATRTHRLEAALWALIIADNAFVADAAHHVFESARQYLDDPTIDPLLRSRLPMIYHTTHGDLSAGVAAVPQVVAAARASGEVVARIRALRHCAYPLRAANNFAGAFDCLSEARDTAVEFHMHVELLRTLTLTASTALLALDYAGARSWLNQAVAAMNLVGDANVLCDVEILGCRLPDVQRTEMQRILSTPLNDVLAIRALRPRGQQLTNWMLTRITVGQLEDLDPAAEALTECYERGKAAATQDYPVMVLASYHHLRGDRKRANLMVSDYVSTFRRERTPLPARLRGALGV